VAVDPNRERARSFLAGEALTFAAADALWRALKKTDDLSTARAVLARLRSAVPSPDGGDILLNREGLTRDVRLDLCRQHAMLTSKDPELNVASRHDAALGILDEEFDLVNPALDADQETLGIAGGICKRRWYDLGQLDDLRRAAQFYNRAAAGPLGSDAYTQINAAFLEDLLASTGDATNERRRTADALRTRIARELLPNSSFWNFASRAEALFGLGQIDAATAAIATAPKASLWELETAAQQIATLAHVRDMTRTQPDLVARFFDALVPQPAGTAANKDIHRTAVRSALLGRIGLALSGGGFRASFYHLGVLARLAELDVLRHVDVLSCVSGGSIVGACYWLALRQRLIASAPLERDDYVALVKGLIAAFADAVGFDLRRNIQPTRVRAIYQVLWQGQQGVLDPEAVANALEQNFYRPMMPGAGDLYMDHLPFIPADHDAALGEFNPARHNWLRRDKVPVLVLNATTVNTGHAWQFTPTWMGESPWAVHDAADAVPRLQWAYYDQSANWRVRLARAVAASACVPGVFEPLALDAPYERALTVRLVDGGVYDNQGIVALMAMNCNVVIISDAAGQLLLEDAPGTGLSGLKQHAARSMDTLMERIRQANYGDLSSRRLSGLLRGMMFLHMKAGLDADPIRLRFATDAYELKRSTLTPSGVRRDFQRALAELRTDLDAFSPEERDGLMACGYQMAGKAFTLQLGNIRGLTQEAMDAVAWPFEETRGEITSTAANTPQRDHLLAALRSGAEVTLGKRG
jgi:predicted acylesterase/phospholipase RssA